MREGFQCGKNEVELIYRTPGERVTVPREENDSPGVKSQNIAMGVSCIIGRGAFLLKRYRCKSSGAGKNTFRKEGRGAKAKGTNSVLRDWSGSGKTVFVGRKQTLCQISSREVRMRQRKVWLLP